MIFRRVDAREVETSRIEAFVRRHEEQWTALSDRIRSEKTLSLPGNNNTIRLIGSGKAIAALLYGNSQGYIFPALDPGLVPLIDRGPGELLNEIIAELPRIRTLIGHSRVVGWCAEALPRPADYRVEYLLMARTGHGTPQIPGHQGSIPGLTIEKAQLSSARELYPLQRAYELEEVLLEPERFNPLISMGQLKESLKRRTIYLARQRGQVVAKAGTNALGFGWAQIGGVYTLPELRGRGIAGAVMGQLLADLDSRRLGTSLFVKCNNRAAIALYRGLGFRELGPFSILYYLR